MFDIRQTETFVRWLNRLRDRRAAFLIVSRVDRLAFGHMGDIKHLGDGIFEMRIHFGAGYRVYFQKRKESIVLLLCGGDKSTQRKDILAAKRLAQEWDDSHA